MKDAGDHISREAAIEAICEDCIMHKMNQCKAKTKEMYCSDYQRIMDIPAADVRPRWIPVSERLPEEWWPVLGLIKFHGKDEPPAQQVLWYLGNGHWREVWRGDMIESDVTHWMPLPQPPKEE